MEKEKQLQQYRKYIIHSISIFHIDFKENQHLQMFQKKEKPVK